MDSGVAHVFAPHYSKCFVPEAHSFGASFQSLSNEMVCDLQLRMHEKQGISAICIAIKSFGKTHLSIKFSLVPRKIYGLIYAVSLVITLMCTIFSSK